MLIMSDSFNRHGGFTLRTALMASILVFVAKNMQNKTGLSTNNRFDPALNIDIHRS